MGTLIIITSAIFAAISAIIWGYKIKVTYKNKDHTHLAYMVLCLIQFVMVGISLMMYYPKG